MGESCAAMALLVVTLSGWGRELPVVTPLCSMEECAAVAQFEVQRPTVTSATCIKIHDAYPGIVSRRADDKV